ncbi:MAG TPA: glycosyltransferase family 39 protein [Bryobacteraceae bacterium]
MHRKIPRVLWIALPLAYLLYFFHLDAVGVLGPDEPRYASIAREMARSGDWITPRLWGTPWFEKPALLYWMTGTAFRLGLGPDLAPRLPVALLTLAFLVFYWWILDREFGYRAAWLATLILGTSAGMFLFSQAGTPDLPVTVTFSASMLLSLPWVGKRNTSYLPAAAVLLGLAVLAKSLPPIALAAPLALRWRWWRDLVRLRVVVPFLVVALPWHVLCYLRNGRPFIDTLFVEHQFGRFTSGALLHVQPWWFYLPVLLGLLLPWSPLLLLLTRREPYRDPRRLFLLAWFLFGLLLFSLSVNKLAGYVLPLLPAAAALMAVVLDETVEARPGLARAALIVCALLLAVFPIATPMLPEAVANGLSRAPRPALHWTWLLPVTVALGVWVLDRRSRRLAAVVLVSAAAATGLVYLKSTAAPEVNRVASARWLWLEISGRAADICVDNINRNWRYGLNYYSVTPLPDCSDQSEPLRVVQSPGAPPRLTPAEPPL